MADGETADVSVVSGHPMLSRVATENVKAWRFESKAVDAEAWHEVTFHFKLVAPDTGYDVDGQPVTRVELDGSGGLNVLSIKTTGLDRSECPTLLERVPPPELVAGDYVEVDRWNETVRVNSDGAVWWSLNDKLGKPRAYITKAEAGALFERFRTPEAWGLCGSYSQAGLMDGGSDAIKLRIGGRDKSVGEYGDSAPPLLGELEMAVDAAVDTHRWRHGDPAVESIIEIGYEELPKPGKTRLMDAAATGDKAAIQAAFASGEKVTDADASGWTPLMYAAGSYGNSGMNEMLAAGADVNARSRRGETALMAAAAAGNADKDLIKAGADVNAANDVGMTTLMLLVQRGESDEVATLLKAGANARIRDKAGRTSLDYLNAANCGRPIVKAVDPPGWMTGTMYYSVCTALGKDYRAVKNELKAAGAVATRSWAPKRMPHW
jgi:hypothetical protein